MIDLARPAWSAALSPRLHTGRSGLRRRENPPGSACTPHLAATRNTENGSGLGRWRITHAAKLAGLGRVFVHVQTMIQRAPYFCLPQKFSIIQMLLAEVHSTKARCRPSGEGMPQVLKIPSRRHR